MNKRYDVYVTVLAKDAATGKRTRIVEENEWWGCMDGHHKIELIRQLKSRGCCKRAGRGSIKVTGDFRTAIISFRPLEYIFEDALEWDELYEKLDAELDFRFTGLNDGEIPTYKDIGLDFFEPLWVAEDVGIYGNS